MTDKIVLPNGTFKIKLVKTIDGEQTTGGKIEPQKGLIEIAEWKEEKELTLFHEVAHSFFYTYLSEYWENEILADQLALFMLMFFMSLNNAKGDKKKVGKRSKDKIRQKKRKRRLKKND